jgi:hypothetical protein
MVVAHLGHFFGVLAGAGSGSHTTEWGRADGVGVGRPLALDAGARLGVDDGEPTSPADVDVEGAGSGSHTTGTCGPAPPDASLETDGVGATAVPGGAPELTLALVVGMGSGSQTMELHAPSSTPGTSSLCRCCSTRRRMALSAEAFRSGVAAVLRSDCCNRLSPSLPVFWSMGHITPSAPIRASR